MGLETKHASFNDRLVWFIKSKKVYVDLHDDPQATCERVDTDSSEPEKLSLKSSIRIGAVHCDDSTLNSDKIAVFQKYIPIEKESAGVAVE